MRVRSRGFIWLRQGLAIAMLAILAACGSSGTPQINDNGYLLTVKISSSDTQESVAQKYGGQAIVWQPQSGLAILKMSKQAVTQLTSRGISMQGTTLDENSSMASPEDLSLQIANPVDSAPVDSAPISSQSTANTGGWSAWAGGWNTWAGGWNTWAGGWNTWAGSTGSVPTLPSDNRPDFIVTKLPQAQAVSRNYGTGVKVAVIDTGIDLNHPMFSGRLAPSTQWKDYVDGDATPQEVTGTMYGHGTAVAGLILQVAPKATILPIRVLNGDGAGDVANVASAISWAMNQGANVINLSLGTTDNNAALQSVINSANAAGIYVVASAGNTGTTSMTYPAAWAKTGTNAKYLLSVGSISQGAVLSLFSSYGTALEFLAVGEGIASAYVGSQVASYNGTSFAAPQVSGALALALSDTAAANKGNLESYLSNTDTPLGSYGIINNVAFLQQLPDFQKRKALFVVGNTTLSTEDAKISNQLSSLGYSVTSITAANVTSSSTTGQDVAVVALSSDQTALANKLQNVSVPVVVMNRFAYDDMGMVASSAYQSAASQTQVTIGNTNHPLAAGYSGTPVVYSASTSLQWGTPGGSVVNVANVAGDATRSVIFGYDKGTTMVGMIAPARRVGFFLWSDGATKWSSVGANLFEAAVTWAVSGN